ncbi:hypothetical protein HID58_039889 [Brassica napus]|uniref:Uncharacterized protein n=1 Tax=Brassica napus TaxID=3708 RepID=A0ABQ8BU97_BRANA|nr:hypothetical protein HID58_039889 [Brassica napus]
MCLNVEKLTVGATFLQESHLNSYLRSHSLNQRQCWRSKDMAFPGSMETISIVQSCGFVRGAFAEKHKKSGDNGCALGWVTSMRQN